MLKAFLLALCAGPPLVITLFLPSYLPQMREELDWRAHQDPYTFLARWAYGPRHWQAMAELDRAQRAEGFITRLTTPSHYGPRYLRGTEFWQARWSPDGSQILTGSATTAVRWNAVTGAILLAYGAERRRDAEDPGKWGYGFLETAWYDAGRSLVAMTSGPHSLWFHGAAPHAPLLLEGDGYEALTGLDGRVALIKNLEHGVVIDVASGSMLRLPHEELNTIALTPGDGAITASRTSVQWWRGAARGMSVPIRASYNPLGFSTDAHWALVLAQQTVELWSTHTGERLELAHDSEATAVCANADIVATGTQDGLVHLWRAADGASLRRFRASTTRIDQLACAQQRLLTLSYNRTDARLWDLTGQPQPGSAQQWPAPQMHWLVMKGADLKLPDRAPAFTQWLEDSSINGLNPHAGGGLIALLLAAWWLARSRKPANPEARVSR